MAPPAIALQTRPSVSPTYAMADRFQVEPGKLNELLRSTVIKPDRSGKQATNEEVAAFIIVANQYGLNPFTREIYAFAGKGGGIVPIVGIDGWAKLVNDRAEFDGCEFEEHFNAKGDLVAMSCAMYAKSRSRPVRITEWLSECYRPTEPWKTMPHRMLRHKAFIQAARVCFSLSGLFDEDEAQTIVDGREARRPAQVQAAPGKPSESFSRAIAERRSNGHSPAPAAAAPAEELQPDDRVALAEPEPPPAAAEPQAHPPDVNADDVERENFCQTVREKLAALTTTSHAADTGEIYSLIDGKRAWLGTPATEQLLAEMRERVKALTVPLKSGKAKKTEAPPAPKMFGGREPGDEG